MRSRGAWDSPSIGARIAAGMGIAFMHVPVAIIVLYAFTTEDRSYHFPPPGLTLRWFALAFERSDIWAAMRLSLGVAALATLAALCLGTLAAFALARSRMRGTNALTLLFETQRPRRGTHGSCGCNRRRRAARSARPPWR